MDEGQKASLRQAGPIKEQRAAHQCADFLGRLRQAAQGNGLADIDGPQWSEVRDMLAEVSRSRSLQGFSPSETATFVFSLKKPLFALLRREFGRDAEALAQETGWATELLDKLGLYTTEVYQKTREDVIHRQQQEMLELSTPVVKLWDGILALPLIGTLDSDRTQVVMETLLQRIVETGAEVAILDITGVPTVDTLVAQHLIKTVTAARLMGADCIISGIRPADRPDHRPPGRGSGRHHHQGHAGRRLRPGACEGPASPSPAPRRRSKEGRRGTHPDSAHGRVPAGDHPGGHARPPGPDAPGRPDQPIAETNARGVLIDISALEIVDSFIGRMIANIAGMAPLLDAETVVVGMQPAVAITLVELGLSLPGVRTALNVEKGMNLLRASLRPHGEGDGDARAEA